MWRFPCDGVRRYAIFGGTDRKMPYSEAYEKLFYITGCATNAQGERSVTKEGIRRIRALNDHYMRAAWEFITATYKAQKPAPGAASEEKAVQL